MTCKNHYMTLKMALTAHNALRDHVPFRALYTTLPVKVRHLMGKWGHYRRKVKFNLIIIIFGQVRGAGLKSPTGRIRPGGPYFAHVWSRPYIKFPCDHVIAREGGGAGQPQKPPIRHCRSCSPGPTPLTDSVSLPMIDASLTIL